MHLCIFQVSKSLRTLLKLQFIVAETLHDVRWSQANSNPKWPPFPACLRGLKPPSHSEVPVCVFDTSICHIYPRSQRSRSRHVPPKHISALLHNATELGAMFPLHDHLCSFLMRPDLTLDINLN